MRNIEGNFTDASDTEQRTFKSKFTHSTFKCTFKNSDNYVGIMVRRHPQVAKLAPHLQYCVLGRFEWGDTFQKYKLQFFGTAVPYKIVFGHGGGEVASGDLNVLVYHTMVFRQLFEGSILCTGAWWVV